MTESEKLALETIKEYAKHVLTLSSTLLVISVALLRFLPSDRAWYWYVSLGGCWLSLIIAIGAGLDMLNVFIKDVVAASANDQAGSALQAGNANFVRYGTVMRWAFFAGVIMFVAFSGSHVVLSQGADGKENATAVLPKVENHSN